MAPKTSEMKAKLKRIKHFVLFCVLCQNRCIACEIRRFQAFFNLLFVTFRFVARNFVTFIINSQILF